MDLNQALIKRDVKCFDDIQELQKPDIFTVRYLPSKYRFVLRKTDLKECPDLEFYENEVHWTNRLKHKNLLPFTTSFVTESHLWTIMPFAEFQSMAELSRPFGLSEQSIALVMNDVLNGVQYLHNNCIVHHSIRASHILLYGRPDTAFRCVLSGLKYSLSAVRSGEIVIPLFDYPSHPEKNHNWMSPGVLEQNLLGYDTKCDVYSIGITCCELANGSTPFTHLEPSEILLNKLNGEIPEPLDSRSQDLQHFEQHVGQDLDTYFTLYPNAKDIYQSYLQKRYTLQFKEFVTEKCLHPEPNKRLNVTQLLAHKFIVSNENLNKIKVFTDSFGKNQLSDRIKELLEKSLNKMLSTNIQH